MVQSLKKELLWSDLLLLTLPNCGKKFAQQNCDPQTERYLPPLTVNKIMCFIESNLMKLLNNDS